MSNKNRIHKDIREVIILGRLPRLTDDEILASQSNHEVIILDLPSMVQYSKHDRDVYAHYPDGMVTDALAPDGCDILSFKTGCGPWLSDPQYCIDQADPYKTTTLCSPKPATDPKQRQIQQLNYDTFAGVMAEMVKKYAAVVL